MKKLLFIYNPTAGKGRVSRQLGDILNQFTQAGWLVSVYPTQCKGDATRIARELGADFDRVVCAGGDGTLSETATGLLELPTPPTLGFLPAGSTNDCAHNLHLPAKLTDSAEIAAQSGSLHAVDVGRINGKPFFYVAAFGAFTDVAYDTPQEMKKTFGHLAYIMAGIAQLPSLSPYHLRIEYEDTVIEDDFYCGMVCNSYSVAGMKGAVPHTERVALDDGLFEVVLVRKSIKLSDLTRVLQSLISKNFVETAAVLSFQASRVTITCDNAIPWTVDGEYGGTYAVSQIENQPRALTVVHGNKP